MSMSIESIEGIGPEYRDAFRGAGVRTVSALLDQGANKSGRRQLAAATGISEDGILKCVNMADLFRINGVASQYAELLENAGVDTVKELKNRNAENLAKQMAEINSEKNLVRRSPSAVVVQSWVSQAKELPASVFY